MGSLEQYTASHMKAGRQAHIRAPMRVHAHTHTTYCIHVSIDIDVHVYIHVHV